MSGRHITVWNKVLSNRHGWRPKGRRKNRSHPTWSNPMSNFKLNAFDDHNSQGFGLDGTRHNMFKSIQAKRFPSRQSTKGQTRRRKNIEDEMNDTIVTITNCKTERGTLQTSKIRNKWARNCVKFQFKQVAHTIESDENKKWKAFNYYLCIQCSIFTVLGSCCANLGKWKRKQNKMSNEICAVWHISFGISFFSIHEMMIG